jgi:hypothetical protein
MQEKEAHAMAELRAARLEESSLVATAGKSKFDEDKSKEEMLKTPEARWGEGPDSLMPAAPPHPATPPTCPPESRQQSVQAMPLEPATINPHSNLWNSLQSPHALAHTTTPNPSPSSASKLQDELRYAREESHKRVSFLEERFGHLRQMEHREHTLAKQEKESLEHSRLSAKESEARRSAEAEEVHNISERLSDMHVREASASASWQRRENFLEERLERTERERDRLIEATNELRADLRASSATASPARSTGKPASDAIRALQHRYSDTPSGSPTGKREAEHRNDFDRCICGAALPADAVFCHLCGSRRGSSSSALLKSVLSSRLGH